MKISWSTRLDGDKLRTLPNHLANGIRVEVQGAFRVFARSRIIPQFPVNRAQVCIDLDFERIVASCAQDNIVVPDGVLEIAALLQNSGQHRVARWIRRLDAGRSFVVMYGIGLALLQEQVSHLVIGYEIVLGNLQRVRPEVVVTLPIADLAESQGTQSDQNSYRHCRADPEIQGPLLSPIEACPHQHYKQTDARQVSVAIRHPLRAHLNKSD